MHYCTLGWVKKVNNTEQSKLHLNKPKCSLRDVTDLFSMAYKIGISCHPEPLPFLKNMMMHKEKKSFLLKSSWLTLFHHWAKIEHHHHLNYIIDSPSMETISSDFPKASAKTFLLLISAISVSSRLNLIPVEKHNVIQL